MAGVRKPGGISGPRGVVYEFPAARPRVSTVTPGEDRDSAGVTEGARQLAHADGLVREAPEVRAERVRALKEQIANSAYRPDPREVAREILKRGL